MILLKSINFLHEKKKLKKTEKSIYIYNEEIIGSVL